MAKKSASAGTNGDKQIFLLLVKLKAEAKLDRRKLSEVIGEIDREYMGRFARLGGTRFGLALLGPFDFAILYEGSTASSIHLSALISERLAGAAETITMPAIELDEFRAKCL